MLGGKKIDLNSLTSLSRSIWLAGLGAYAKTNEKVIDSADKAYESANETFQELLAKGESMQEAANEKTRTELENRVGQLKARLGLVETEESDIKITALAQRIDTLAEAVSLLIEKKATENAEAEAQAALEKAAAETKVEANQEAASQEQAATEETVAASAEQQTSADSAASDESVSAEPKATEDKPAARRTTARRGRRANKAPAAKS